MKKIINAIRFGFHVAGKIVESRFGDTEACPEGTSMREDSLQYVYYIFHDSDFRKEQWWYFTHTDEEARAKQAYDNWDADMRRNV